MNIESTYRPGQAPRETLWVLRAAHERQIAAIAAEIEALDAARAGGIGREKTDGSDPSGSLHVEAVVRRRMVPDDEAAHLILLCSSADDESLPPREAAVQVATRQVLRLVQLRADARRFVGTRVAPRNAGFRRAAAAASNHRIAV